MIFPVIVVIIIAIIWYCKRFQKYHVNNCSDTQLQSGTLVVTDASLKAVELQENPSYVASLRKEVQTDNTTADDHKEVDITANPSYTPFANSEVKVNPLRSRQEADNLLYSTIESDERNVGYDYI